MRPEVPEAPLRDFVRQEGGIPLLLLHASDMSQMPEGVTPSKPILPSQVEEAGFRHALLGHFHDARTSELVTYPGSPEPLGWAESGRHCTALVTIEDGGALRVELDDVNARQEERRVGRALEVALDAFDEGARGCGSGWDMRLPRIEIEGFGSLQGMDLRFGPAMNLVVGPNEAGKSTLQEAIVTGLYGLRSGNGARAATVERADRWRPWQGGDFGLALEFELADGTQLRVERDLDAETTRVTV